MLCASVSLYVITYESDTGEQVDTVLPSECSSGECSNSFVLPVDSSASQYSVSVTAVGLGVTSDSQTVGGCIFIVIFDDAIYSLD